MPPPPPLSKLIHYEINATKNQDEIKTINLENVEGQVMSKIRFLPLLLAWSRNFNVVIYIFYFVLCRMKSMDDTMLDLRVTFKILYLKRY